MSLLELFYWLEYTPLLVEMRSSPWLFPVIATVHLFGLVIIGGSVLVVNLRLLGFGLSRQPAAQLARDTEPLLLAGIGVMLATGVPLFLCFATKYYYLAPFWVKLASLTVVLLFTFTIHRRVVMDEQRTATASRLVALISMSLWISVALGGRLIGFP
ncbi:MAG: DUF6644 family protein [Longimicrobiales bacterium]